MMCSGIHATWSLTKQFPERLLGAPAARRGDVLFKSIYQSEEKETSYRQIQKWSSYSSHGCGDRSMRRWLVGECVAKDQHRSTATLGTAKYRGKNFAAKQEVRSTSVSHSHNNTPRVSSTPSIMSRKRKSQRGKGNKGNGSDDQKSDGPDEPDENAGNKGQQQQRKRRKKGSQPGGRNDNTPGDPSTPSTMPEKRTRGNKGKQRDDKVPDGGTGNKGQQQRKRGQKGSQSGGCNNNTPAVASTSSVVPKKRSRGNKGKGKGNGKRRDDESSGSDENTEDEGQQQHKCRQKSGNGERLFVGE